ncbi:MAG: hypothetical protein M3R44_03230 [Candidatus Eremiobacteraeota bacterium]|nr:hypothetical protein [Candidatus Eremiobacteraeota bacterium]
MANHPKGQRTEIAVTKGTHEISREIEETRERLTDTIAALIYKTERPVRFIERVRHVALDVRRRAETIKQVATDRRPLPARVVAVSQLAVGFLRKDGRADDMTYLPVEAPPRRMIEGAKEQRPNV